MTFETINLNSRIGSQVIADKETLLRDDQGKALRELLELPGVVLCRGIEWTGDEQCRSASTLDREVDAPLC